MKLKKILIPLFLSILILFSLIPVLCTPEQSESQKKVKKDGDTSGTTEKVQTQEKEEETNPILKSAKENRDFNPEEWLKSDRQILRNITKRRISRFDPIIKKISRRYGFDWRLISAQIYAESNFNTEAESYVGALGLMQVMPRTAEYLGFKPNQMLTPEIAITAGCLYNRRLYKLWGRQKVEDPHREAFTFASYNAGRGTVLRVYDDDSLNTWQEVYPDLPKETQDYVHKIYLKYDFYSKHFIP